eukprot:7141019-Karenia_brevis.AAC.1
MQKSPDLAVYTKSLSDMFTKQAEENMAERGGDAVREMLEKKHYDAANTSSTEESSSEDSPEPSPERSPQ